MTKSEKLDLLIKELSSESIIPHDYDAKWRLYRGLVNQRPPMPISQQYLDIERELLEEIAKEKGVVYPSDLVATLDCDRTFLWQGDITRLAVDAIVNAANKNMLGCFNPNHNCIDNIIHTYAGVPLRSECNNLMEMQGHPEPTGKAKITKGHALPAKHVIHTVGPIVTGSVTKENKDLLKSSYLSSLELAEKNALTSIAFPCISTGVFSFPNDAAADIAISTVNEYLKSSNSNIKVIFNVFTDKDKNIYENKLNMG